MASDEMRNNDAAGIESEVTQTILSRYETVLELDLLEDCVSRILKDSRYFRVAHTGTRSIENLISIADRQAIHPDDRQVFRELVDPDRLRELFATGRRLVENEMRFIIPVIHKVQWITISLTVMAFSATEQRVLLTARPISSRRINAMERETEKLQELVELDPLTGLYNKRAVESLVASFLENYGSTGVHTLLMCDIDNFKSANDTFGHQFGDALICDIAGKLGGLFRQGDVVGRVGGDEFVVLLKNVSGRKSITRIVRKMCTVMNQTFPYDGDEINISTSIGIAIFPDDGQTFEELFKNADRAMYFAKNGGKNGFRFYGDVRSDGALLGSRSADEIPARRVKPKMHESIGEYIFKMLYSSSDIRKTMPVVLQLLGSHFNVSRVFISEHGREPGGVSRTTFQWHVSGLEPMAAECEYSEAVRKEELQSMSDDNHAVACHDTSRQSAEAVNFDRAFGVKGAQSFIRCTLLDEGVPCGCLGFVENRRPRVWTADEAYTLGYVASLVNIFLLKQQAYDNKVRMLELSNSILEGTPVMIYIVDPRTHKLLYVNQHVSEHIPEAKPGRLCHEAFMGYDRPCSFCPIKGWEAQGRRGIYRCETFSECNNDWAESSATGIKWLDGSDACLCACVSVRKYKRIEQQLTAELDWLKAIKAD